MSKRGAVVALLVAGGLGGACANDTAAMCALAADRETLVLESSGFPGRGQVLITNVGQARCDVTVSVTSTTTPAAPLPFLALDPTDPEVAGFALAPGAQRAIGVYGEVKLIGEATHEGALQVVAGDAVLRVPVRFTTGCHDDPLTVDEPVPLPLGAGFRGLVACKDDDDTFVFTTSEPVRFELAFDYRWDHPGEPVAYLNAQWDGAGLTQRCPTSERQDVDGTPLIQCLLRGAAYPGYSYRASAWAVDHTYVPAYDLTTQSSPISCLSDDGEPDNDGRALWPLAADASIERRLCPFDVDWHRFDLASPASVTIELTWLDGSVDEALLPALRLVSVPVGGGAGTVVLGTPGDGGEVLTVDLSAGAYAVIVEDTLDAERGYRLVRRALP